MKRLMFCMIVIACVGCKKKSDDAASGGTTMKSPDQPSAARAATEDLQMPASGIPECDGLPAEYKKFQGCAKIGDEDRIGAQLAVGQIKDLPALYTNEKDPDQKAVMKTAAAGQCKDETDKLHAAMTKAGC